MPNPMRIIQKKNSSTAIGMRHEVTINTATASIILLSASSNLEVSAVIPPWILEIMFARKFVLSPLASVALSSTCCVLSFAEASVSSTDEAYVASIRFDAQTLVGTTRKITRPKSASLAAKFFSFSFLKKTFAEMRTHAIGISTLKAAKPVIVTRYFSRKMAQSTTTK